MERGESSLVSSTGRQNSPHQEDTTNEEMYPRDTTESFINSYIYRQGKRHTNISPGLIFNIDRIPTSDLRDYIANWEQLMVGSNTLMPEEIPHKDFCILACGFWQGIALKWLTQYENICRNEILNLNNHESRKMALHSLCKLFYADLTGEDMDSEGLDEKILF